MRPLRLKMSAFGPYAGAMELDLDSLGTNGIYLITGETGAGKTTIFDGITYALFGEPSGENRESSMLRSKYAEPGTPTYVELDFEYGGEIYKVKRNPDYERPKTKGEGMTTEKADAVLTYPNGNIVTKVTDVNEAISEILGVNRRQFAQISMIAQGDFLKLLTGETKDRKEIFRNIFKTAYYNAFQEQLKKEAKELNDMCNDGRRSVSQYINGILCDENSVLAIDMEKAKLGEMAVADTVDLLDKIIKEDSDALAKSKEKQLAVEGKLNNLIKEITDGENNEKNEKGLVEAQLKYAKAKENLSVLDENYKKEKAKVPKRESFQKEYNKIEIQLPNYDELEVNDNKVKQIEINLKKSEDSFAEKMENVGALIIKIEDFKKRLKTLEKAEANREKLISQRKEPLNRKVELDDLNNQLNTLRDMKKECINVQKIFLESNEKWKLALNEYTSKNEAFLYEQAGILAEQLTEGAPCPVCGALDHPNPASKAESAPTEEELKRLKQAADKAQQEATLASQNASQTEGNYQGKRKSFLELAAKIIGKFEEKNLPNLIDEAIENTLKKIEDYNGKIAKEEENIEIKRGIDEKMPQIEKALETENGLIDKFSINISSLNAQLKEVASHCNALREKLEFESKTLAVSKMNSLGDQIKEMNRSLTEADDAFQNCNKETQTLAGEIKQLKTLIDSSKKYDLEELNIQKNTLSSEKNDILEIQNDLTTRIDTNNRCKTSIEDKIKDLKNLEDKLTGIQALSDTANGTLKGKEKIMLETYIQMTYFDRIIYRANQRLGIMSGNQYQLKRRDTASNNKMQSGLELDVIDHYNGTERSVKSLSGGECFKASLSLALGLSDEVQSSAGGIKLDTMFVDEGFGSLDEESLQQAMNALTSLSADNRLVGIISHVPGLKDRIDRQIVVTKEKTGGSKAVII